MPTPKKAATIDELAASMAQSKLLIVTDYRGLGVADLEGFRTALRPAGAEFRIAKNTLAKIAAGKSGVTGLDDLLAGPTGLVLVHDDIVAASKAVADFVKSSRVLEVRGGVLDNKPVSADDITAIATLPSAEELRAKLLGMLVSPMSRTLGVLGGPARSMVHLLNARAGQLGG